MDAQIRITSDDYIAEFASLWAWLQDEPQLRGCIQRVDQSIETTHLGGAIELLTITLGSSGVGVALAKSIVAWLETRRPDVTISLSCKDRIAQVSASGVDNQELLTILERVLNAHEDQ